MAKKRFTAEDLSFPFGANAPRRRTKAAKSKKPSKPRGSRGRPGGSFGS